MSETEEFITEKEIQVEKKSKPKRQPTEAQLLHYGKKERNEGNNRESK